MAKISAETWGAKEKRIELHWVGFFADRLLTTGWWFGTFGLFFHILGISWSQLTFIFFRGVGIPTTSLLSLIKQLSWLGSLRCQGGSIRVLTHSKPGRGYQPVLGQTPNNMLFLIHVRTVCVFYTYNQIYIYTHDSVNIYFFIYMHMIIYTISYTFLIHICILIHIYICVHYNTYI